jgi:hypothetical protein
MTTTNRPARTQRNARGTYASGGAQHQDGKLPIYDCNACGAEVVWATSNRTGRKYLANCYQGMNGTRFYVKASPHKCGPAATKVEP